MASKLDLLSLALVFGAAVALAHGLIRLAEQAELWGMYWLVTGGFALLSANERERFLAGR